VHIDMGSVLHPHYRVVDIHHNCLALAPVFEMLGLYSDLQYALRIIFLEDSDIFSMHKNNTMKTC
jgi:hypothetical protein